jgi:hypothetical protein
MTDDRELKVDEVTAALEAAFEKSACGVQRAANRQPPSMWRCTCGYEAPTAKALLDHHNDKHERI